MNIYRRNNLRKQGSHLAIITVVIVVILAAGLGWVFWQNLAKNPDTKHTDNKQTSSEKAAVPQTKQILSFDDWNLKVTLTNDLPELEVSQYRNEDRDPHLVEEYYVITSKHPTYQDSEGRYYPRVRVYRMSENEASQPWKERSKMKDDQVTLVKKIGDYYYKAALYSDKHLDDEYKSIGEDRIKKIREIENKILQGLENLK